MAKHRYFRSGEPETDLTFRTNVYPLQQELNEQLRREIEAIVDLSRCSMGCAFGEVHIRRLTFDYAKMVRLLLEGQPFVNGKYTLREVQ